MPRGEARQRELNKIPNKIETLIHLSGMVSIQECENNPKLAYELNVIGSLKQVNLG